MDEHRRPDDDVARIAAADPAAGVEPQGPTLRAAVDLRIAAAAASPDEVAGARSRRRTSWPARVAGVAAAALVVGGGGGYAVGAAGGNAPPPAEAAIVTGTEQATGEAGGGVAPMAGGDASVESARTADLSYWGGWGRTVFTARGLSGEGGRHAAWTLDPGAVFSEGTATSAAAVLGLSGAPELRDGSWVVGPTDGTAASLWLSPDGNASLSYYDPAKDPWSCGVSIGGSDGSAGATEEILPAPEDCTERDLGPAPSGDAAADQLRGLLGSLGLDAGAFEIVPESYGDNSVTYVSAYHVLDGQRSGLSWSASVTGAGIQSLYGSLAPVVPLGDYAVVSAVEAVARLNDPRFGSGGGPIAYGDAVGMVREGDTAVEQVEPTVPSLPATVTPGSPIGWPVGEVTIVSARLGVALHTQVDGAAVLAPTYELTDADGGVWTVIAVADSAMDFSSAG